MNAKGFTLIEVVLLMIVIAIVTAIAFNHAYSNRVQLVAQTEVLKTHLRFAQSRAMNANQTWGIEIYGDGSDYRLFQYDGTVTQVRLPGEPQDNVDLTPKGIVLSPNGVYTFDGRGIPYYDPDGNPPGSALTALKTITLTEGTESKTITITPNTGFIP